MQRLKTFTSRAFLCVRVRLLNTINNESKRPPPADGLWSTYMRCLERRPLLTKCITSGLISFAADVVCQNAFAPDPSSSAVIVPEQIKQSADTATTVNNGVDANEETVDTKSNCNGINEERFNTTKSTTAAAVGFDWRRNMNFTILGVCLVAPMLHYWYGVLARRIPGVGLYSVAQRLFLDQAVFAPFVIIPSFFSCSLLLEGHSEAIVDKLRADWFSTVLTNFSVWLPCQVINFRYMPPELQVLFANAVGFFWNIYMSYMANKKPDSPGPDSD